MEAECYSIVWGGLRVRARVCARWRECVHACVCFVEFGGMWLQAISHISRQVRIKDGTDITQATKSGAAGEKQTRKAHSRYKHE